MNLYQRIVFPILQRCDAERVHERTVELLALAQRRRWGRRLLRSLAGAIPEGPVELLGLTFPNVLGIAAGFDKDVRVAPGLAALGFGHVEVGTLTPRPQSGNPRPRVFRLPGRRALINRMGFPNCGVEAALPRLRALSQAPRSFVLGVSLGMQRETPLADAARDYLLLMRAVYPFADYLAVNVSSPNTPGLRELQGEAYLRDLLGQLVRERTALADKHRSAPKPLLVKIAPDLADEELQTMVGIIQETGIDGLIATNTTLSRDGLAGEPLAEQSGGLSGAPLAVRSNRIIARVRAVAGERLPIIGVGGVQNAADVRAKLEAGASLVQVYSGLVYEGPRMAGRILRDLAQ